MTTEDRPRRAPIVVGILTVALAGHYLGMVAGLAVLVAAFVLILVLPGGVS